MTAITTRAAETWAHMLAKVDPMPVCVALDWLCEENGDDIRDVYKTVEAVAQQHLDARPDDHAARRLLGEWLTACGDERGEGYRGLAAFRVSPRFCRMSGGEWLWILGAEENPNYREGTRWYTEHEGMMLPRGWINRIPLAHPNDFDSWRYFESRTAAEDAAAVAFLRLPESRRLQLLKGEM